MKPFYEYCEGVLSGKIIACKPIYLACVRFKKFLNEYDFKEKEVERVIKFISLFKHYSGKTAGQRFELLPWQQFLIANIFGFYIKGTNKRLTNSVYLQISRKSGKSFLAAAIALYCLLADNESDPQVLFTATSFEQAGICFGQAKQLALQLDNKEKYLLINKSEVLLKKLPGKLKVLAADATKLDGYNPSVAIIDEYHAHKTSEVRDVMVSGQGARNNPLEIIITTAGLNTVSPCKIHRDVCLEILEGTKEDDHQFSMIFELDEEDDWLDEKVWSKASPNLDVTVSRDYMARMINQAKINPSKMVEVKTKLLNLWVESFSNWIPSEKITENSRDISWEKFTNKEVIVGVDLSAVSDLTAASFMFHDDQTDKLVFKTKYYLPEESLNKTENSFLYRKCVNSGDLTLTPGNVVDYNYIKQDIDKVRDVYNAYIQTISYDKYNATQWATEMQKEGYDMLDFSQGLASFNRPTKEIERLIMSNKVEIDNNELTKNCFNNVVLRFDHCFNCKPDKEKSANKIDGVISMCQCIGGYLFYNNELPQITTL